MAESSIYERIGGSITVDRLVESFYRNMDELPEVTELRAMHAVDLGQTKQILKQYLAEWMGGPKLYSAEKGHPRLRQRHLGFPIGEEERDSWLLCMHRALAETVKDEVAAQEIYDALAKLADWMRNKIGNPHDSRTIFSSTSKNMGS
jgi:hemoglobin